MPPPVPWADLHEEILLEIACRLADIADLARFSAVCTSWRSVAAATTLPPRAPWILFPERRFFSVDGNRHYPFPSPAAAAAATVRKCSSQSIYASSSGYILTVEDVVSYMSLINPFDGEIHHLPLIPIPFLSYFGFDVSPQGVVVLAEGKKKRKYRPGRKHRRIILFWRPGDARWSFVPNIKLSRSRVTVLYSGGKFLLFDAEPLNARVIELDAASLSVAAVLKLPPVMEGICHADIREASVAAAGGERIMIWFFSDDYKKRFFRAEYRGDATEWAEVDGAGDHAVFGWGFPLLKVDAAVSGWTATRGFFYHQHKELGAVSTTAAVQLVAAIPDAGKQLQSCIAPAGLLPIVLPLEWYYNSTISNIQWMMPPSRLSGICHRNDIATSSGTTTRK